MYETIYDKYELRQITYLGKTKPNPSLENQVCCISFL